MTSSSYYIVQLLLFNDHSIGSIVNSISQYLTHNQERCNAKWSCVIKQLQECISHETEDICKLTAMKQETVNLHGSDSFSLQMSALHHMMGSNFFFITRSQQRRRLF